jgi:protein-tyrosine phosphatase
MMAFRQLGIRKIFTIRTRREISEDWDVDANTLLDEDQFFERTLIEVEDHESADLLQYIPATVESIEAALENRVKVYVHW